MGLLDDQKEIIVSHHGDVLLQVRDQETGSERSYRCMRNVLRRASTYFDVLFDPQKFSEGITIETRLRELELEEHRHTPAPASSLPVVSIFDVGDLPKDDYWANVVFSLFLHILHTPTDPWAAEGRSQSINLIALLAIVADRFSALAEIAGYLKRQRLDITLMKVRKSATAYQTELENRQMLFAGMAFEFPTWVQHCSAALIVDGSKMWNSTNSDLYEVDGEHGKDALWWRLPNGVEGITVVGSHHSPDMWH